MTVFTVSGQKGPSLKTKDLRRKSDRLLEAGADPNVADRYGKTPADMAAYLRDRLEPNPRADETVRLLQNASMQNQKTPDTPPPKQEEDRTTSLLRAAENGSALGVRRQLRDGADPNVGDRDGVTALHYAAWHGDRPEAVKLLLEAKADPNVPDHGGATALHYAASHRSPELATRLLEAGADPNVRDKQGLRPVDVAVGRDATQTASVLREANTQHRETPSPRGQSAHRKTSTDDHYKQFADEIIKQMEKGTAPWQPGENRTCLTTSRPATRAIRARTCCS